MKVILGGDLLFGTAKILPTPWGKILVGEGDAKPKKVYESVYVCPGRVATHHTPLTGLAG